MEDLRSKVGALLILPSLLVPVPGHAVEQTDPPVGTRAQEALRQAALQALWPADIPRLCAEYLAALTAASVMPAAHEKGAARAPWCTLLKGRRCGQCMLS